MIRAFLIVAGALGALTLAVSLWFSQGPDFDVEFSRDLPSELSASELAPLLATPARWPEWFHQTASVELAGALAPGAVATLKIDPNKGPWRKYDLIARVNRFEDGRALELQVLEDSSGRLTRLFDRLVWTVEILPPEKRGKSLVRGTVRAHTHHWKARLFGRVARRILLFQVFFPNTLKLAEFNRIEAQNFLRPDPGQKSPTFPETLENVGRKTRGIQP